MASIATVVNSSLEKAKKGQKALVEKAKARYNVLVKNPDFKPLTITTASGAVTLGAVGGAFGTAVGVAVGSAAGLVPALFTFGLSIPVGAVVGGAGGFSVGCGSGAIVGGAAGFGGYKYRIEIKDGVIYIKRKAVTTGEAAKRKALTTVDCASSTLARFSADGRAQVSLLVDKSKSLVSSTAQKAKALSLQKRDEAVVLAKNRKVQVTTASAATGGVAGVITGGTVGLFAGAALGVVPALFTFGLSIPVGATIGLATGAAAGSAVGSVSCGAAGYVGYSRRKEIGEGMKSARKSVEVVKAKAVNSANSVGQTVKALVSGGTGETA